MNLLPPDHFYRYHSRYYRDRAEKEARHRALLAEAEQGQRGARPVAAVRRAVGAALVRVGRRLTMQPAVTGQAGRRVAAGPDAGRRPPPALSRGEPAPSAAPGTPGGPTGS